MTQMRRDQPDFDRIEREVDRLLELDATDRADALLALGKADPDLAQSVGDWLKHIDASRGFLEHASRFPGQRIGPWALLRIIGRGGMGEVWLAERADGAYQKHVAIKFLRLDRAETAGRLIQERELLARLEHPNIARLIDAGDEKAIGAYLITDWIDGDTLDQWLAKKQPALSERLDVFRQTAEAVAHAHRQLIIHRDIKPANIMVDARHRPFLLDFGIARAIDRHQLGSETRDLAITPSYAAPEQLLGEPVGTRTDVYALGAVLYRMLTNEDAVPLEGRSLADFVHHVCHVAPPPPSTRGRAWLVPRDLDAICLKAMEKSPDRRYQSVDSLLADLHAYAEGEPVKARQGGIGYRAGRFIVRHRYMAAAAGLLVIAILGGIAATWRQSILAAREADRANSVRTFLLEIFSSIDPERSKGGQVLAEDLVREGEERLDEATQLAPDLRYELFGMLARMRLDLGQYEARLSNQFRACELATQAFGGSSDQATVCTIELADSLRQNRQLDLASETLHPILVALDAAAKPNLLRQALAYEVQFMIERDGNRMDAAEAAIVRSIELARQAEQGVGPQTAHSLEQHAVFLNAADRLDEAEPLLLEILRFDQKHPDIRARSEQINSRWNLLTFYWSRDRYRDVLNAAAELSRETESDLGRNHAAYFRQQQLIANVHARLGQFERAIDIRDATDAIDGIDRWANGRFRQMLWADQIIDLSAVGRTVEGQLLAERTLALTDTRALPAAPAFIASYGALYGALLAGDAAKARKWFDELTRRFAALNPSQQTGYRKFLLQAESAALRSQGLPVEAVGRLRQALDAARPTTGGSHTVERLTANLAFALIEAHQFTEAAALLRTVRADLVTRLGADHLSVLQIDAAMAAVPEALRKDVGNSQPGIASSRFARRLGRPPDTLRLW